MTSLLMVAALGTAQATEIGDGRPFGLGLQLGQPFGVTGKVYLGGRTNAIDFTVGTYYASRGYYYDGFQAQVAYHWHLVELTSGGGVAIPFRIGVGGFVGTYGNGYYYDRYGDLSLGARVPFGLDFDLERAPVQFYIELAIRIHVYPGFYPDGDGGIGARYYF
jgi:hypothetical protein